MLLCKYSNIQQDTLFAYVIAMLRIMPDDSRKTRLVNAFKSLIDKYSDSIQLASIGFPAGWEEILTNKRIITLKPVSEEKKKRNVVQPTEGDKHEISI